MFTIDEFILILRTYAFSETDFPSLSDTDLINYLTDNPESYFFMKAPPLGDMLYGIVKSQSLLLSIFIEGEDVELIICNLDTFEMRVVSWNEGDSIPVEIGAHAKHDNKIIDLSNEGDRWEGGELNGNPFGYGCLFDCSGYPVYEGYIYNNHYVCYGTEYYPELMRTVSPTKENYGVKYRGYWFYHTKCGRGILYDHRGDVDCDKEWELDLHLVRKMRGKQYSNKASYVVSQCEERLSLNIPMYSLRSLQLSPFMFRLKELSIKPNCFRGVREFIVERLLSLASINVGRDCFTHHYRNDITLGECEGTCRISDCPNLRRITFSRDTFYTYKTLDLSNLISLQTISFGRNCFVLAPEFSLRSMVNGAKGLHVDLPSLMSVVLRENAFSFCHTAIFESKWMFIHSIQTG